MGLMKSLLNSRIVVDIDNERPYSPDILGISQTDEVLDFEGNIVILEEGNYIYTITENFENGVHDHILAEGYIIRNPYKDKPYKWCCKIEGKIKYLTDI